MCRRQGYMIQNMEWKCVTTKQFWKTHTQVNQVLHLGVSQLSEKATEELIETNLKPCIATMVIEDCDAFRSEVPDLVSQEFNAQAPKIIQDLFKNYVQSNVIQVHPTTTTSTETTFSGDLQQQLYFKMKRSLQDRANDPALWEVLKCKFEKSSTSNTSCRDDDIHSHHNDHQEDDAPPVGEKRVKRHKVSKSSKSDAWVEETIINEDEVIPEDETPELITELQDVDKRVPTIFDYERIRATLNDALSNQFKNAKEYAYHLEQTMNFMENQIVWESIMEILRRRSIFFRSTRYTQNDFQKSRRKDESFEVVRITTDKPHGLDFMKQIIMMRENDKPDSFSETDFKYLNKNDNEDLYYLCRNKKLGIESYQIKVNLTAQTLMFSGIEAHEPYFIVDKPSTGTDIANITRKEPKMDKSGYENG
ncbi:hypothetical protein Tco_1452218 [Tanacetum coccineum]